MSGEGLLAEERILTPFLSVEPAISNHVLEVLPHTPALQCRHYKGRISLLHHCTSPCFHLFGKISVQILWLFNWIFHLHDWVARVVDTFRGLDLYQVNTQFTNIFFCVCSRGLCVHFLEGFCYGLSNIQSGVLPNFSVGNLVPPAPNQGHQEAPDHCADKVLGESEESLCPKISCPQFPRRGGGGSHGDPHSRLITLCWDACLACQVHSPLNSVSSLTTTLCPLSQFFLIQRQES